MFEIHAGHRLLCDLAIRPHLRPRRPLVCSSSKSVVGKKSGMGVSFFMVSSGPWAISLGEFSRFLPCQPSAHYTRLLHVGGDSVDMDCLPD